MLDWSETVQSAVASAKASIAVLLVLAYGFALRSRHVISAEAEQGISKLGTSVLLPALLFSEIGPLATPANLKEYFPIIPASILFQAIAFAVASISAKAGMPQHFVPMFIFNNATSLPLLLLDALASSGALDPLVLPGQDKRAVISKARVLILINALVGNITRFAFGPVLMRPPAGSESSHEDVHAQAWSEHIDHAVEGAIRLPDGGTPKTVTLRRRARRAVTKVRGFFNPPLVGGLLAILFGVVPFLQTNLFGDGILSPIAQSLTFVGKLYTALQMLVLGAQLASKKGSKASPLIMLWLFAYRFFLAPVISIATVYAVRTRWPDLMERNPFLAFVICISNIGPPALTLAAIAQMAGVSEREEGAVARILTGSYMVTPLIALSVTAAIRVVSSAYS